LNASQEALAKWKELGPLKISEVINRSEIPINMKLEFEENPEDQSIVG